MSERFDDIIRTQMEGLESPVPKGMFDKIQTHPDVSDAMFDAGVKNKLQSADSPVIEGMFDKIAAGGDIAHAPFDGVLQSKLFNYESTVPADMWERIMQRKRRRRPVAWWWMAAGLFLLLGGGTWYAVKKLGNQLQSTGRHLPTDKSIVNTDSPQSPISTLPTREKVTPSLSDSAYPFNPSANNTVDKYQPQRAALPNNSNTDVSENGRQSELERNEISTANNKNGIRNNKVNSLFYKKNGRSSLSDSSEVLLNAGRDQDTEQAEDFTLTLSTVHLAVMQQLRNAARLLPSQLLKAKPRSPVIPCPVNADDRSNNWYADVYTSAFLVNKNISDKLGAKNVKDGIDSTLHRQVSYNAGINLVKNIGENVLLKTGVQYNRLNESFRLTRINERKLVTTVSIRTVIIAPGDTVYIRDTSVTEYIGRIQHRRQNVYQQWDIPVIIGYEFGGENIRLNANAGIIADIRSSYSGEMLDTTQQIINTKSFNGKPVYKTNVGLSLYAGLTIIKPLGERTSLLIEPFARIGLGNTTTENAWFRQKNSAAGLSIGLRYKLNGAGQRR